MAGKTKDLFLCHSSQDKGVVGAFAKLLDQRAITYWYDEAEIKIGDSISKEVGTGLLESRYLLAFVSPSFLRRKFPDWELRNALTCATGREVLVVLLNTKLDVVLNRYPLLRDKRVEKGSDCPLSRPPSRSYERKRVNVGSSMSFLGCSTLLARIALK